MATAAAQVGDPHHGLAHIVVTSSWRTDGTWNDETRRAIAHVLQIPVEQVPREPVPYHGRSSTSSAPSTSAPPSHSMAPSSSRPSTSHTSHPSTSHPSTSRPSTSSASPSPSRPHDPAPPPHVPADQTPTEADTAAGRAHDLYAQGQRHYDAHEYLPALEAYEASYAAASAAHLPTAPTALLAISLTHERLGHQDQAIAALRQYQQEAPNAPDHAAVAQRLAWLEQDAAADAAADAAPFTPSPAPSSHASTSTSHAPTTTVPGDGDWYREVRGAHGTQRYVVHPEDAQHLAPELSQAIAAAGSRYDHDRVRVFQRAAGIAPDGQYGGTTRAALIFWGVANPPRAQQNPTGTYSAPRHADGTTLPPIASATVGAAAPPRADKRLARQLAHGVSKAIARADQGWQRRLHQFQIAAGLPPGEYDGTTYNALVHYGIRRPPTELVDPDHRSMASAYPPPRNAA